MKLHARSGNSIEVSGNNGVKNQIDNETFKPWFNHGCKNLSKIIKGPGIITDVLKPLIYNLIRENKSYLKCLNKQFRSVQDKVIDIRVIQKAYWSILNRRRNALEGENL